HALDQSKPRSEDLNLGNMEEFVWKILQRGTTVITRFLRQALAITDLQTKDLHALLETAPSSRIQSLPEFLRKAIAILHVVETGDREKGYRMLIEFQSIEREAMLDLMSIRDPEIRAKIEPVEINKGRYGLPPYPRRY